jgi:FMN phosphatase YigB (HAD superfamily)
MLKQKIYTAVLFDLDDTILDTSKYLVRPAMEKALNYLAVRGVISSVGEGFRFEITHRELLDKPLFFEALVKSHGKDFSDDNQKALTDEALGIYFGEPEESAIRTFPEAHEVLSALAVDYDLYLVTLGKPATQEKKVRVAKIEHFFRHIWFPDFKLHHNKEVTFRTLLETTRISPERILCVGNRIDNEIVNGKSLGMKTCWVEYGEHVDRRPTLPHEIPDFTIPSIRELISKCHL